MYYGIVNTRDEFFSSDSSHTDPQTDSRKVLFVVYVFFLAFIWGNGLELGLKTYYHT